jgi:hypothetical protein
MVSMASDEALEQQVVDHPPWAIIEEPRETAASFDPRLNAEALFNTEGFVRIDDEEAVSHAEQLDAVRKATGLAPQTIPT